MITIKSLKRINEAKVDAADEGYKRDILSAEEKYDKVLKNTNSWKHTPRLFSKDEVNKAYDEKENTADIAAERLKASKHGLVSKRDYDDVRFEKAKVAAKLRADAAKSADVKTDISSSSAKVASKTTDDVDKPGMLRKIGSHISEYPIPYAAAAAGIVGLLALQKRKDRLPEPGQR